MLKVDVVVVLHSARAQSIINSSSFFPPLSTVAAAASASVVVLFWRNPLSSVSLLVDRDENSPSVRSLSLIDHPEEQQQQQSSTVYTLIEIYRG